MKNSKILIVDDDVDITHAISTILKSSNYSVVAAGSKSEGLEKIKDEKPDLIILDVMMETWQAGFEMCRDLKKSPELKDIPILMLTGVKCKTGIEFKSTAGDPIWLPVEGFLDKPVKPEQLRDEVAKLLAKKD